MMTETGGAAHGRDVEPKTTLQYMYNRRTGKRAPWLQQCHRNAHLDPGPCVSVCPQGSYSEMVNLERSEIKSGKASETLKKKSTFKYPFSLQ